MRYLKPYNNKNNLMSSLTKRKWVWLKELDLLLWPWWRISENGPLVTSSLWLREANTGTVLFKMRFQGSKENFTGLGTWYSPSEFKTRPCAGLSLGANRVVTAGLWQGSQSLLSPCLQAATIMILGLHKIRHLSGAENNVSRLWLP